MDNFESESSSSSSDFECSLSISLGDLSESSRSLSSSLISTSLIFSNDKLNRKKIFKNKKVIKSNKIILNARGFKFEVIGDYFEKIPNSRLARLFKCIKTQPINRDEIGLLCDDYSLEKNEFYFNKDPSILNFILNFYQNTEEKIHFNIKYLNLCIKQIDEELAYWSIGYENYLENCCLNRILKEMNNFNQDLKRENLILDKINNKFDFGNNCLANVRKKLWYTYTSPSKSIYARLIQIVSILLIITSIVIFIISSMEYFRSKEMELLVHKINIILCIISAIWFSVDYFVRFWSTPFKKINFILNFLNVIDVICNIVTYVELSFNLSVKLRNIFKFIELLRLFRMASYSTGIRSLGYTLNKSRRELFLLFIIWMICLLIFSGLIYFAEKDQEDTPFISIPSSIWCIIITMTTVGYGDIVPKTVFGRMVSGVSATFGLVILAMPTAVISANFGDFYKHKRNVEKIKKRAYKQRYSSGNDFLTSRHLTSIDIN